MECAAGGEFFDFITHEKFTRRGIGESLAVFYMYQIVSALDVRTIVGLFAIKAFDAVSAQYRSHCAS